MTDLRKAAEMALEALELYQSKMSVQMFDEAVAALRQALAEDALDRMVAENQRLGLYENTPAVKSYCGGKPNYCTPEVTPEVAKRKSLAELLDSTPVDAVNMSEERVHKTDKGEREWVGFTDGEKQYLRALGFVGIDNIESRLKRMNT